MQLQKAIECKKMEKKILNIFFFEKWNLYIV